MGEGGRGEGGGARISWEEEGREKGVEYEAIMQE